MTYHIFEELLASNSRLNKESVLAKYANDEVFKSVCYLALNPYIRFYVRKIPKYNSSPDGLNLQDAILMLSKLSKREITGHAATEYLVDIMKRLSEDDAKVIRKIIDKDLKCGVSTATVNKNWEELVPVFNIQACIGYDERKIPSEFVEEPKLDGMRVVVLCDSTGDVTFMTRGGRELETLDHLKNDLIALNGGKFGFMFDTEVISGNLETTVGNVKRKGKNKKNEEVFLYVFDGMSYNEFKTKECSKSYKERRAELVNLFENNKSNYLILNESVPFPGGEDKIQWVKKQFSNRRKNGQEGSIIKDLNGLYEFDRTSVWMKVKPFETLDVTITGYYPGNKGTKNEHRLGGFTFELDGVESRVGGGFSDPERDEFWEIRDEMVGTIIEVEMMELTAKGATRHCNFIRRRDYKGEKN